MELIVFSDLHGYFDNLNDLKNKSNLFFLGDICTNKNFVNIIGIDFMNFYKGKINAEELNFKFQKIKDKLNNTQMNFPLPNFFIENNIFVLPGNHETQDYYEKLTNLENIFNLHLKKIKLENLEIIGHGGMISPHDEIQNANFFIYSDKKVSQNLEKLNASTNCVILMHELPIAPYCIETRKVIERIKPKLVIGGHNHRIANQEFEINGIKYLATSMKGNYSKYEL
ncbi:MAG: metallophosphoesterase [Candidatus Nanoarchaeia archaeon]|nr:metallophosphoesterase [Candidatus Nanoarchaeia archaeon]